jgi:hypothetical protein
MELKERNEYQRFSLRLTNLACVAKLKTMGQDCGCAHAFCGINIRLTGYLKRKYAEAVGDPWDLMMNSRNYY